MELKFWKYTSYGSKIGAENILKKTLSATFQHSEKVSATFHP